MRTIVKTYGLRGSRRCHVIREGKARYLVERYVGGKPKRKRFDTKAHAERWARKWYEAGLPTSQNLTLRQLLDKWMETEGPKQKWRSATWANYRNHRKRIEEAIGPDTLCNGIGHEALDNLWAKLTDMGMTSNQIAAKVRMLRRVFGWGLAREYVSHNRLATWDIPEVVKIRPKEYPPADVEKILAQWNYRDGWEWRPWALTMLEQSHGIRINALLSLRWDTDADLLNAVLGMRAETDKTREAWSRPLSWDALSALLMARWHGDRLEKDSPWVFYGKGEAHYTYGAYHAALLKAERKAGVKHERFRASHGFRKTAVGNVRRATGDHALALLWVGHRNLRDAADYVKGRDIEFAEIANHTPGVPMRNAELVSAGGTRATGRIRTDDHLLSHSPAPTEEIPLSQGAVPGNPPSDPPKIAEPPTTTVLVPYFPETLTASRRWSPR